MSVRTQSQQLLKYLDSGRSITALEALDRFDCLRLAARILELRKAGHKIIAVRESNGRKNWARYTKL